ncbi:hypothetical protein ACLBWX_22850, partial [Methylobacterium sp. M6A4_1b]
MASTQTFEASSGRSGSSLTIDGFVYAQRTTSGSAVGTLSVNREFLEPDASLKTSSVSGYLSISRQTGTVFDLNALSIRADVSLLSGVVFIGYRNGVQVVSAASGDLVNLGLLLGETRYQFSSEWQNLTEVRVFRGSVLDVSLGQLGFGIDDVSLTVDTVAPNAPTITTVAGLTNDATPTITGTAEAGSTVTISDNGTVLGTAVTGTN